jgi:uncharacterized protein YbjT (DUF2867 family)
METENTQVKTTLVLGGTGKTGRRVVERLQARGMPVRVGSRSGEPPFDWDDQTTWAPALEGVESVYVSYYPDIAAPGAVAAVRCAWFMQNFDEYFLLEPILGGEVIPPAGNVPEPFVDAEDIADVAMAALTEYGHAGEVYELTSPRLLTFEEAVGEIAKATVREIRFVPVTLEEYESMVAEADVPPEVVSALIHVFGETLDGRNAHLTDGVRRALGREPKDFSDYARDVAATGVWSKAA